MRAVVTIIDDDGNCRCAYDVRPSHINENDLFTQYVFTFEYCQFNCDKPITEKELQND